MKRILGTALAVVAFVVVVLAAVVAFPGLYPPLRQLILNRAGWVEAEFGSPKSAWEYARDQIPVPSLQVDVKISGSATEITIKSDHDVTVNATLEGPLGKEDLADVFRRIRITRSGLPDGEYKLHAVAQRCVSLSGKAAEYRSKACKEATDHQGFLIDTVAPKPSETEAWLENEVVIITGSAEDLSGLKEACVSGNCVAAKGGNFRLQVPLGTVNKHLRKRAAIVVILADAEGNRGEARTYLEKPKDGWIVVDGEDALRCIGHDDGGVGGNPPDWTVELLEDGQVLEAFGTTPVWYTGVRVAPVLAFLLAIISWRARTTLIVWAAGLLDGLASLVEKASGAVEEKPTVATEES